MCLHTGVDRLEVTYRNLFNYPMILLATFVHNWLSFRHNKHFYLCKYFMCHLLICSFVCLFQFRLICRRFPAKGNLFSFKIRLEARRQNHRNGSVTSNGWSKKSCSLGDFSITKTTQDKIIFAIDSTDKILSLWKFWTYSVMVKIVKVRHSNGYINWMNQNMKNLFLEKYFP